MKRAKENLWEFVDYVPGRLTALRDGFRFEDFYFENDEKTNIFVAKHYGDHEWESATSVEVDPKDKSELHILIEAAFIYHKQFDYKFYK